jgi:hypothetical protein
VDFASWFDGAFYIPHVGEWDFTILADGGRILLIECKTKVGKLIH